MKLNRLIFCLAVFISTCTFSTGEEMTISELRNVITQMEGFLHDITVEYDVYIIPPISQEDANWLEYKLLTKDGYMKFRLTAADLLPTSIDVNDPDRQLLKKFIFECESTMITEDGGSWFDVSKKSFNGSASKSLSVGGWPRSVTTGSISLKKPYVLGNETILGFSVLHFPYGPDGVRLSDMLSHEDLVRIDNTIREIEGFKAISVDFLQKYSRKVCRRIYFSKEHGYTPVRTEYINANGLSHARQVISLRKIAENYWFPEKGMLIPTDSEQYTLYEVRGNILYNQALKSDTFDIAFPAGTEVWNAIDKNKYVQE